MQDRLRSLILLYNSDRVWGYCGRNGSGRGNGTAPWRNFVSRLTPRQVYARATIASLSCWVLSASQLVVRGGWRVWMHSKKCSI